MKYSPISHTVGTFRETHNVGLITRSMKEQGRGRKFPPSLGHDLFDSRSTLIVMKDNPGYGTGECVNDDPFLTSEFIDDKTFYVFLKDFRNAENDRCVGSHTALKHRHLTFRSSSIKYDERRHAPRHNPQLLQCRKVA